MRRTALAIALAACVALCGCSGNGIKRDSHDEMADGRFEYENDDFYEWEFSTVVDTHTGVVYLVFDDNGGKEAVGGITPLLNGDGSVTIDPRYGGSDD